MEDKVINVLDKVNVKVTKSDIEGCHRLGDSRKTIVRFANGKHLFEALKKKKRLMSVDLTSIWLDKNTNLFLSQNLSDYNDKIAFHCQDLRRKRLIDSTWAYDGKVFIKIQDNGNKEEIKCLSQLTRKFPIISLILMIDTHLFYGAFFTVGESGTLPNVWCGIIYICICGNS